MATRTLLRGAHVLTMDDKQFSNPADILIEDGVIIDVDEQISSDGADVVELSGSIVLPGLVDSHVHLWQSVVRGLAAETWGREYFGLVHPLSGRLRADDMYGATYGGAIELLLTGTTTVFDFCHATNSREHAESSLNALADSGIRGLFGFCFRHRPESPVTGFDTLDERAAVLESLVEKWKDHDRVGLGVALNNIDHVEIDVHKQEVSVARQFGLRQSLHSNLPGQIALSAENGLLGEDLIWVHAATASDEEMSLLAARGGSLSITPEVEAALMGMSSAAPRAKRHHVPVAVGTDVPAGVGGNLFAQLRIARATTRTVDVQFEHLQNRPGARTSTHPSYDSMDLLRMATIDGARVLGLEDHIGTISPGKQADLLVVSTEPFGLSGGTAADFLLYQATARHLTHVFVGGEVVVRDGRHVSADMDEVRRRLDDTRDWILGLAPGSEWPTISAEMRARYEAGQGKAT